MKHSALPLRGVPAPPRPALASRRPQANVTAGSGLGAPAAGTVLVEDAAAGTRVLYVDGGGLVGQAPTYLTEDLLDLTQISVLGGSHLEISLAANVSVAEGLLGDNTTTLSVASGATLYLPSDYHLRDLTLSVQDGQLQGWEDVVVGSGATLELYSSGQAGGDGSKPGYYQFSSLRVGETGTVYIGALKSDAIQAENLGVSINVTVFATNLIEVESGGSIDGSALGYRSFSQDSTVVSEPAVNASGTSSNGIDGGGGGGHAGPGGAGGGPGSGGGAGGGAHGAALAPAAPGGAGGAGPGGGEGGPGGAAIALRAGAGGVRVDGAVRADGRGAPAGGAGGGGAGGSLYIFTEGALSGSGLISATGGDGGGTWNATKNETAVFGGAGSGGRVTLVAADGHSGFEGTVRLEGGRQLVAAELPAAADPSTWGAALGEGYAVGYGRKLRRGAAGSLLIGSGEGVWDLLQVGDIGVGVAAETTKILDSASSQQDIKRILVSDARLEVVGPVPISFNMLHTSTGTGTLTFAEGSEFSPLQAYNISGGTVLELKGLVSDITDVVVGENSTLYLYPALATNSNPGTYIANNIQVLEHGTIKGSSVNISAASLSLGSYASVHADALGYSGGTPGWDNAGGPGAGGAAASGGSGGGHGGRGRSGAVGLLLDGLADVSYGNASTHNTLAGNAAAKSGGAAHGSSRAVPGGWGSGGGAAHAPGGRGGAGGGRVLLEVSGNITLAHNSSISANGEDGAAAGGGGGAGGSVYIVAGGLLGQGSIRANGGAANHELAGAGGGGRVVVNADNPFSEYNVTFEAKSGVGDPSLAAYPGYQGTIRRVGDPLVAALTASNTGGQSGYGEGDTIAIRYSQPRMGLVQLITSEVAPGLGGGGFAGNASFGGRWRLAFKYSDWSGHLPAAASAAEVKEAIDNTGLAGAIAVDRNQNDHGNGFAWSITFYEDFGNPSLLIVDDNDLYSIPSNSSGLMERASMNISYSVDRLVSGVDAPQTIVGKSQGVEGYLQFSTNMTGNYTAAYSDPDSFQITVSSGVFDDPTGSDPEVGSFTILNQAEICTHNGRWVPDDDMESPTLDGSFS